MQEYRNKVVHRKKILLLSVIFVVILWIIESVLTMELLSYMVGGLEYMVGSAWRFGIRCMPIYKDIFKDLQ